MNKKEITTDDVEFSDTHEYEGLTFTITCPECGDEVNCSDWMNVNQPCSCGYKWNYKVIGIGTKEEEDEQK